MAGIAEACAGAELAEDRGIADDSGAAAGESEIRAFYSFTSEPVFSSLTMLIFADVVVKLAACTYPAASAVPGAGAVVPAASAVSAASPAPAARAVTMATGRDGLDLECSC